MRSCRLSGDMLWALVMLPVILSACLPVEIQAPAMDLTVVEKPVLKEETQPVPQTILALGDSYTIGSSVSEDERWLVQLVTKLREQGLLVADPTIVAQGGWTTDDLERGIQEADPQGIFDLVTLLIGVNDQFRGYPVQDYRPRFASLLAQAVTFAGGDPGRVVVLSIPDWGVMPFAGGRRTDEISSQIDAYNAVNFEETKKTGAMYVDVTGVSRRAAEEFDLIAADGLHPSAEMYALWVEQVLPVVMQVLTEE